MRGRAHRVVHGETKEWEETTRASSKWEGDDSGCNGKNKTGHPRRKNVVRQRSSVLIWAKVCLHLAEMIWKKGRGTRTNIAARLAKHTWMANKKLTGAGEKTKRRRTGPPRGNLQRRWKRPAPTATQSGRRQENAWHQQRWQTASRQTPDKRAPSPVA